MTLPASVMVECPICRKETLHEVLSGRIGGKAQAVMDSTVRCRECGQVHHIVLKVEKPLEVPMIISWMDKSIRTSMSLGPDEVVSVSDEVMCGDDPVLITAIESKGARVNTCKVRDIQTIWGKRFDKVRVPFSISHLGKSYSEQVLAVPDEEFYIGDILRVGRHDVVIHSIKTREKSLKTGGATARDIVRVYASIVRKTSY
ncbi:MAG: HVO_0476 family zinc finger protein [Thermoplasmata archaeon]